VFCFVSISALDLEISTRRHVYPNAFSTFQETYCSAEKAGRVFRISHNVIYWQYKLAELLRFVITEKPTENSLSCWESVCYALCHTRVQTADIISLTFKPYMTNRVLPNDSGSGVLFDRIYRVISSANIIYRYQNHALRETEILISRFANCN